MKNLGEAKNILGMEITRDRGSGRLWLSQENYSQCVGEIQHGRGRPVTTLSAGHFKLSSKQCPQSPKEKEKMSRVLYASAMRSLIYVMVCTRADLSYTVSTVSRFIYVGPKVTIPGLCVLMITNHIKAIWY